MRLIGLSKRIKKNKTQSFFAIVDDEDFERINQWNWHYSHGYAQRVVEHEDGRREIIHMHRVVLDTPEHLFTDHINQNKLDNRKSNLRFCTKQQNACNVKKIANRSSKFKGVSWHKRDKIWTAQIVKDRKLFHLGYFEDQIEAARAYDTKAKELFGEFAALNLPRA